MKIDTDPSSSIPVAERRPVAWVGGCAVVGDPAVVTVRRYLRGPALVRGASCLVDTDGIEIPCVRRTVAVCVCGASRLGAMCDGTHRFVVDPL